MVERGAMLSFAAATAQRSEQAVSVGGCCSCSRLDFGTI